MRKMVMFIALLCIGMIVYFMGAPRDEAMLISEYEELELLKASQHALD